MSPDKEIPTMQKLIHQVLTSDKFDKVKKGEDSGFFDTQEKIFIPNRVVPHLVKEITSGPSIISDSKKLEEYFALCQVRIQRAIKNGLKNIKTDSYTQVFLCYLSKEFLKSFSGRKLNFASLYIDLVGSTLLSMKLSSKKLSTLISIFTQEMASVISINHGYVLKYAGDSVIAFFPSFENSSDMSANAVKCAKDMRNLIDHGINKVLENQGYEPLKFRIGIEEGENDIIQIGGDIDIVGFTMNIAGKITGMTKPNCICIGQHCYSALDENGKKEFTSLNLDSSFWKYQDSEGNLYKVYENQS